MGDRRRWAALAAVLVVAVVVTAIGGRRWLLVVSWWGSLASGLFAATAVVAWYAYRERRDPGMLLVGVGCAGMVLHPQLFLLVAQLSSASVGSTLLAVAAFSYLAALLVLAVCLLLVVPWRERRGRPPLTSVRVVGATLAGFVLIDLVVAVSGSHVVGPSLIDGAGGSTVLERISMASLVVLGIVVAVHASTWKGRFVWVSAAGATLAAFGAVALGSTVATGDRAVEILGTWTGTTPVLIAACLGAFVLAGLHLESSRMRRATDRAAAVMEGRAEIASMVAHDVRGPVTTIKGLATTTKNSYERLGDAERLEFIGMIETESSRLLDLVNQTALALKVDAETLTFDLRSQELGPIVRMAVDAVETGEHPITTDVAHDLEASVDVRWLTEAIRQGVENAVKFSPPDGPIQVRAWQDGELAAIEIRDHGPGVPEDRRAEVFERFSTWRPAGYEDHPGSALGLFIVRGIARAHGGEASLGDAPGGGTILRIVVPAKEQAG